MPSGLEQLTNVKPDHIGLDRVRRYYNHAIEIAFDASKQCGIQTKEGEFAVIHSIANAYLLRHLIKDPRLFATPLYENTGGPANNPHRIIDNIGNELFPLLYSKLNLGSGELYIEENHQWQSFGTPGNQNNNLVVNIDTLDGTSNIASGHRDQASGIMITNPNLKRFLGGSLVSFVDDALIVMEPGKHQLFRLCEKYQSVHPAAMSNFKTEKMQLATLGRHLINIVPFPFPKGPYTPDLSTFGGYGLLRVATGQITTMFDPGQIWYEAVMWGLMAEKIGLQVSDFENNRIDWYEILKTSQKPEFDPKIRIPIVISHNEKWHWQFLDLWNQEMQKRQNNLN